MSVARHPRYRQQAKGAGMSRRIRVRGVPRGEPDVRLYVLALIELARQLQEEEKAEQQSPLPDRKATEGETRG
jgi:hypothetical protein